MAKDILKMSRREVDRLMILRGALEREVTQWRAAEVLGLSERQVRRLVKRIREEGADGIIHRSRGRRSVRKMSEETASGIRRAIENRYVGFGPTLAAEMLREREGIEVSREKLRQLMLEAGLWKRARRRKRAHEWRDRMAHCGQMVQVDGSEHDWLEGRGPKMVLMGYIDDAASHFFGRFYEYEGVYPAMDSLERYIRRYGRPVSLYIDKHSTYKTSRQPSLDELLKGQSAATQVGRACRELGIEVIHAGSPQAKGRIERSFGTHQDRLIKVMRLEGISTMEQANAFLDSYLPWHNKKFARQPLKSRNLHRRVPHGFRYRDVFCLKEKRIITNGYTVKWKGRELLIDRPTSAMRRRKVEVREQFDGQIEIIFNGRRLKYQDITDKTQNKKPQEKKLQKPRKKSTYIQPADHPWRRPYKELHYAWFLQKIGQ
jgi:transposase